MEYGLIGEHLKHSFSSVIHLKFSGMPYELLEISPDGLDAFFGKREFKGINVTIPYKAQVIPYLDYISPEAESLGAVNTIVNLRGSLSGFNTDYYGFIEMAHRSGIGLKGRKVLVLGNGGAGRTVAQAARDEGASEVDFAVRTPREGCRFLLDRPQDFADYEIVVNATPLGTFPEIDSSPIELKHFHNLAGVIDCVYNPLRTKLVLEAEEMGVPACCGLVMLVEQARRSEEIFHARTISPDISDSIVREIQSARRNLVLFGMPASGKTVIGRNFAREHSLPFVDTDELIVRRAGKSIQQIFESDGEAAFRSLERQLIAELSALQGQVISVGGGAVIDPENVRHLKMNGVMVQVKRDLSLVKSFHDRPLMKDRADLEELFSKRRSVYESVADACIVNDSSISEALSQLEAI